MEKIQSETLFVIKQPELWELLKRTYSEIRNAHQIQHAQTSEGGSTRMHDILDIHITVLNKDVSKVEKIAELPENHIKLSKEEYMELVAYQNVACQTGVQFKCRICGFPKAQGFICATCGEDDYDGKANPKLRQNMINKPYLYYKGPDIELDYEE